MQHAGAVRLYSAADWAQSNSACTDITFMEGIEMAKSKAVSTERISKAPVTALTISAEERRRMIAEAAYYRAEHRGFVGGDPIEDWLTAEAELEGRLNRVHH